MKIIEVELTKGVNIQIWKDTSQKIVGKWPRSRVKTIDTYTLEWQVAGGKDWNLIEEFTTQKKAMTHLGKMAKAAENLEFKIVEYEQPRQAIQTAAL
jgi:hypothetical protein